MSEGNEQIKATRIETIGGVYKLREYQPGDESLIFAQVLIVDRAMLDRYNEVAQVARALQDDLGRL